MKGGSQEESVTWQGVGALVPWSLLLYWALTVSDQQVPRNPLGAPSWAGKPGMKLEGGTCAVIGSGGLGVSRSPENV